MQPFNKGIIAWFIYNPVAANLLLIGIFILGFLSLGSLKAEFIPKPQNRIIYIAAAYPGASPAEVELGVTLKIEDAIRNIPGLKKVKASSYENRAELKVEADSDFDMDRLLGKIKIAVDNIDNFPKDTEKVIVSQHQASELALQVQLYGKLDQDSAKQLAQSIKRDMLANTIIRKVETFGSQPYEISVELSREQLQKYDLTLRDVANRIKAESINLPSGSIETEAGSFSIRVEGQAYKQKDFEKIILLTSEDGRVVRLEDVATVRDDFIDAGGVDFFDDDYSVGLTVFAVANQNSIEVAEAAKAYVEAKKSQLPEGVQLKVWADITRYIDDRFSMMSKNLMLGALLVFLVLAMFMDLKIAFWVMAGLPVCYLGAFIIMPAEWVDVSINMVSLFGFILVLGIIVDDAIVVGESVSHEVEQKGFSRESVLAGTKKVALPSIFGVFTTIVAFTPTLFFGGPYRLMPYSVGVIVCLTLIFSLIESKWILPSHLADMNSGIWRFIRSSYQEAWQKANNVRMQNFVRNIYLPILSKALQFRYASIALFIMLLLVSLGLFKNNIVKYELLPNIPADLLVLNVSLRDGAKDGRLEEIMLDMRDHLYAVQDEYAKEFPESGPLLRHVLRNNASKTNGRFFVELMPDEERFINSFEVTERWQKRVGKVSDASISFASDSQASNRSLSYMLVSVDKQQLRQASEELMQRLDALEEIYGSSSTIEGERPEYVLNLKPKAFALGLTLGEISLQVREAFYGIEAQRFPRDNEEVKVMVRFPSSGRNSLSDLEDMRIRTKDGRFIPLKSLVDINYSLGDGNLLRVNSESAAIVSASVSKKADNLSAITKSITEKVLPDIFKRYPRVSYKADGAALETNIIEKDLPIYFLIALFGVFVLLAIPLRSYAQPIIIMSAIPFGIVGAIWGHLLLDYPISLMSIFGIIALSGVVVNDSLLMVDFVNKALNDGKQIMDAVAQAASRRFRAIMLTTITTFVGLMPMLLEGSLQAESMVPMAVSLGFGILFATTITLILVPCLYLVLEDIKSLLRKSRQAVGL